MPTAQIFHNPRCSKSRNTLALLQSQTDDIEIIKYLENPPSTDTIKRLLDELNLSGRDILRKNESEYRDHGFANPELTETQLIELIHQHPKVMERPIVSLNNQAIIGRPPENVLELFA